MYKMQKVLICDPDKLFRWKFRYILETKGFVVQGAFRPSEAVKCVLNEKFAAIIFNMQPEDFNGVPILAAIKAIDYKLPVITVTDGDVTLSSVSSIIHESFQLFQKPVDCNVIVEAVCDAVQI